MLLEALRFGELIRSWSNHHDVRRMLHHGSRQRDRMTREFDIGDGTRCERCAVHDCRIHFIFAVGGEGRAAACVEERIILEHFHDSLYRIQC